jgi:hypothetical protein
MSQRHSPSLCQRLPGLQTLNPLGEDTCCLLFRLLYWLPTLPLRSARGKSVAIREEKPKDRDEAHRPE